jgi:hypothetical protein
MRRTLTVILLTGTSVHGRRKSESIASSIQSTKKTSCSTYRERKERTSRKKPFNKYKAFPASVAKDEIAKEHREGMRF